MVVEQVVENQKNIYKNQHPTGKSNSHLVNFRGQNIRALDKNGYCFFQFINL